MPMLLCSLPVIVYHHVNDLGEDITAEQFEAQMGYLADEGYRTVFLKDWIQGNIIPDGKTVAITFDDGYLDNWVYAYPIIKKYGLRATIFVSTVRSRVDLPLRPNLDDVWAGHCSRRDLPQITPDWEANRKCVLREEGSSDFLTWQEMRKMEVSGHIDIQSHSHYHRDFFVSDQIVDFNQNKYFGVGWATDGDKRYGIPIYHRKSAMMARRYFDDPGLRDFLADKVRGPEYFRNRSKRQYMRGLLRCVVEYKAQYGLTDSFETKEEQRQRIFSELVFSKRIIEEQLGKTCDLICWPWGEYSDLSVRLAREAGYNGAVAFSPGANLRGTEAGTWHIKRFPPPKDINEFASAVANYSSPALSLFLQCLTKIRTTAAKIRRRSADGQLLSVVKRKLVELFRA